MKVCPGCKRVGCTGCTECEEEKTERKMSHREKKRLDQQRIEECKRRIREILSKE